MKEPSIVFTKGQFQIDADKWKIQTPGENVEHAFLNTSKMNRRIFKKYWN